VIGLHSKLYRGEVAAPPETDIAKIRKYCRAPDAATHRNQLRLEAIVRGNAVTIFDCRPLWHSNLTGWCKLEVAKLRYSASGQRWSLYWADRNGRWHRYDGLEPGSGDEMLNEIDRDPTCIFWG